MLIISALLYKQNPFCKKERPFTVTFLDKHLAPAYIVYVSNYKKLKREIMNKLSNIFAATLVAISFNSFAGNCPALSGEFTIGKSDKADFFTTC